MKGSEAMRIIGDYEKENTGFMVHFERIEGSILHGDHFPEHSEHLIPSKERAWELARRFADATFGECVNIYVINQNFVPVEEYEERKIKNR